MVMFGLASGPEGLDVKSNVPRASRSECQHCHRSFGADDPAWIARDWRETLRVTKIAFLLAVSWPAGSSDYVAAPISRPLVLPPIAVAVIRQNGSLTEAALP